MKLLLDHCVPRRLARHLPNHQVRTTSEQGWQKLRNGQLLKAAANAKFDAMLTTDQNIKHEQNLEQLPLSVIVLIAVSNKSSALLPLLPQAEIELASLTKPSLIEIRQA